MTVESGGIATAPRRALRPLTIVVLLCAAAVAIAVSLVTRQVVHDQEQKLLKQRTDEAALYLSGAIGSVQAELDSIAASAAVSHEDPAQFQASNRLLTLGKSGFRTVALVQTGPQPRVAAFAGADVGDLGAARINAISAAVKKSQLTGAFVATPLLPASSGKLLGFAYAAPQLPGYAVYAEATVHPEQQAQVTQGQPFSELTAAVYAVPRPEADQLIAASGAKHLPLTGSTASAKSSVGQGAPWLLVAKARHPLVGSVATATPWALLGIGLLAALLAAAVVETLARRRDYADAVAEARTRELKQSLADLASAHEQLVRQERLAAIGELASTIGHELRNPLGVISNALFLLRSDIEKHPSDAAQRHLATADREVSAATVIVSDLLEFARQRDPVMTDLDLVALVDEVLTVLPPPSGITISREVPMPGLSVIGDRDMLRQVLLNLVGNAYQAMPDGGTVTVSLSEQPQGVQLRVRDTGTGLTDEVKDNLFQPFFTTKARGVGLGLAVSKRIVDAHSGTITVSGAPGEGAEFAVSLPQITLPRQQTPADNLTEATS